MPPSISRLVAPCGLALALGLGACASPSDPAAMTYAAPPNLTAAAGRVGYLAVGGVAVTGGRQTNPLWTSQVSNAHFRAALETTLQDAGYLGADGAQQITADLVELKQPLAGLEMSVTSRVRYRVTQDGWPVFDEMVSAVGTASPREAFLGFERLRLANERSIQDNIRQFLTRYRVQALTRQP